MTEIPNGFEHHLWRDALVEDLRLRPDPVRMTLERTPPAGYADSRPVRRFFLAGALLGISVFGTWAAINSRSTIKPIQRPLDAISLIQLEPLQQAAVQQTVPETLAAPKLVKTTSIKEVSMFDPSAVIRSQPSQEVVATADQTSSTPTRALPEIARPMDLGSPRKVATPVPRPTNMQPAKVARLSGIY